MRREYFLVPFAVSVIDLAIFSVIYSIHVIIFKEFSLNEAMKVGGYAAVSRIVYGQFIFQMAILGLIYYFTKSLKYIATVAISTLSLIASYLIFLGEVNLLPLFNPLYLNSMGAGFAIVLSTSSAWLIYKYMFENSAPNKSLKNGTREELRAP